MNQVTHLLDGHVCYSPESEHDIVTMSPRAWKITERQVEATTKLIHTKRNTYLKGGEKGEKQK